ncbi:hypothetical protein RHSIM_Rhsim10G0206200 [Rhododendron simsii]|uniref:Aconitase A/isopropylmalate dehydratase small subunit swivel domain-containing protein n=1 Tax=Rhododendron simsii TaxID=118357 RepID=A0A834GFB8_RHOSS|nr:hypothetical protein RHSIM_Rhsim10G0206200 [Rhododendron simsii]
MLRLRFSSIKQTYCNGKASYFISYAIVEAACAGFTYKSEGNDTIILAGTEYGTGSSRDWAAKGPMLLGVKAVIAKSFESTHWSNLVGMGIIPLCFKDGEDAETLGLTGRERYTIDLPSSGSEMKPGQDIPVSSDNGKSFTCTLRFDTEVRTNSTFCLSKACLSKKMMQKQKNRAKIPPESRATFSLCSCHSAIGCQCISSLVQVELAYFDHGGILHHVIRKLLSDAKR